MPPRRGRGRGYEESVQQSAGRSGRGRGRSQSQAQQLAPAAENPHLRQPLPARDFQQHSATATVPSQPRGAGQTPISRGPRPAADPGHVVQLQGAWRPPQAAPLQPPRELLPPAETVQPLQPPDPSLAETRRQQHPAEAASSSAVVVQPPPLAGVPTSLKAIVPVPRPNHGMVGKPVKLLVNHFKVAVKVEAIFHYDVSLNPTVTSKAVNRALEQQLVARYRASELGNRLPVYDGRANLFTAGPLPFDKKVFDVSLPDDPNRVFKVTLKFVARLDSGEMDAFLNARLSQLPQSFLQALDIALREWPSNQYFPSGRSFFDKRFGTASLTNGAQAWGGFHQSLRPTLQGLALNVNMSATAFYDEVGVLEFLNKAVGVDFRNFNVRLRDAEMKKATRLLAKINVTVTHRETPRRYRIAGLTPGPTKLLRFRLEDGTEMKVVDYFWEVYGYEIRYLEIPCIVVQAKKPSYLPMEVCKICPRQKYTGKLDDKQTTNIMKFACQSPDVRKEAITEVMKTVHGGMGNIFSKEFGFSVDPRMTEVRGRILPPPQLQYQTNAVSPMKGEWNMMQSRFCQPATIKLWGLVNLSRARENEAGYFADCLMNRCNQIGMKMERLPLRIVSGRIEDYRRIILQILREAAERPVQLIVCIMDAKHHMYGELKRVCETEIGVVTQCCLRNNIGKESSKLSQYLANLAMKINVKVGGKNVMLLEELPKMLPTILDRPTIIFGADVSHPSSGDSTSPSLAAVVASVDWPSAINYLPEMRSQSHRVERIVALGDMVKNLLLAFYQSNRRIKPERILFFRDGVSEGQFDDVLRYEVDAIFRACNSLEQGYCPRLTFVVVQKRHHTRFFPTDFNKERNNVLPGTVVDSIITHPSQFDFYLCSHKGLQGTSRPTHYHVLYDDNKFKADELQKLINNLCYTYARCTKAVSVVPPAYYAHLLAYRARLYLDDGSDPATELPAVKNAVKGFMFYC